MKNVEHYNAVEMNRYAKTKIVDRTLYEYCLQSSLLSYSLQFKNLKITLILPVVLYCMKIDLTIKEEQN
jgi:hypothetical protein